MQKQHNLPIKEYTATEPRIRSILKFNEKNDEFFHLSLSPAPVQNIPTAPEAKPGIDGAKPGIKNKNKKKEKGFGFFLWFFVAILAIACGVWFASVYGETDVFKFLNATFTRFFDYSQNVKDEAWRREFEAFREKTNQTLNELTSRPSEPTLSKSKEFQELRENITILMEQIRLLKTNISDKATEDNVAAIEKRLNETVGNHVELKNSILNFVKDTVSTVVLDHTGQVDYALGTAGGKVIAVNLQNNNYNWWSLFSFASEKKSNLQSAQNLLDPNVHPGNCWGFMGSTANVTIKLRCPVKISEVLLEHPHPRVLNEIHVPKQFEVYGTSVNDISKRMAHTLLFKGEFEYDMRNNQLGKVIQYFKISNGDIWDHVTLNILSNYKSDHRDDYTCVYRFRVHSADGCQYPNNSNNVDVNT
jgi:hypothetical protein